MFFVAIHLNSSMCFSIISVSSISNHQITSPQAPNSLSFKKSYLGFMFLRVYVVGPWHCFVFVLGVGVTGCVGLVLR